HMSIFDYLNRSGLSRSQFAFTLPFPSSVTAEASRQFPARTAFIQQNEMRWLTLRQCFKALPEEHSQTLLVIDGERFTALRAEPEVLYRMTVCGKWALPGKLLKAVNTSLAIIEIGRAFRMGAFQIHRLCVAPFPMDSLSHLW